MKLTLFLGATIGLVVADARAVDVTVQPAAGSGFVVKDAGGATDRFRVQENGQISVPGIATAAAQTQALCTGASGQLGPCTASSGGTTYSAGTGLGLAGATFSVAPTYQLPQSCASNQIPQWNGSAWACATLPSSGTSFTLPYLATQSYSGALFYLTNTDTTAGASAIVGSTSNGIGVRGTATGASGTSTGVYASAANGVALKALSVDGYAGEFDVTDSASNIDAVVINNAGNGYALTVNDNDTAGVNKAVYVQNKGLGDGVEIYLGNPGPPFGSAGTGLRVNVLGGGDGINVTSTGNAVVANATASGADAVHAVASSTFNRAGYFETAATNAGVDVYIKNQGSGAGLVIEQSAGDLAVFGHFVAGVGLSAVARIDSTGKGFFDGGTQTGGADVAELVPTVGAEPVPGDVVEIDPDHADRFRLCVEANSSAVAGVISTKPGVTLNDETGADKASSGPALALAGRVPVKVTNANGAIRIRDLLVASSIPGHAMRAPTDPAPGTVIGKALEDFDATDGSIQMLVWSH